MLTFICYPKCSTCQKAKKWLDDNGIEYEIRNIVIDNPSADEIEKWHHISGLELKKFFNTSGLLYKKLELKDNLKSMTEHEQYVLLSTDGMLVKRPLLIDVDKILIGFKSTEWESYFYK